MPTYEYVCEKCGHEFELQQPITDNALKTCPKDLCAQKKWGKGKVKRMISTGGGIIFKGSGFYATDYRSDGYKASAKKDVNASRPTTSSSDSKPAATTKTETKSESKTESKLPKPAAT